MINEDEACAASLDVSSADGIMNSTEEKDSWQITSTSSGIA